jgi:hypothetical protein
MKNTVPQESLDNAGLQIECWMGRYYAAKGDLERAIKVLDALWDKKSGKQITQEWAELLSKYGEKE